VEGDDSMGYCKFPAIYNFGDSNSDTGGIAAAFYQMAPQCGETFFHRPSGRGCDGRLIIDFIAKELGLPYLSAYLNSIGANFKHGANFATGGSTIRRLNESVFLNGVSPFSLDIQVVQFTQFKSRTGWFFKNDNKSSHRRNLPRPEEFSKALYTFDIGQNDIAAGFRSMTVEQFKLQIPDIINQFGEAVKVSPLGCLAVSLNYSPSPDPNTYDPIGCDKAQNDMSKEFNTKLKHKVIELRQTLSDAALTYVDLFAAKYQLIANANKLGFLDKASICCGYHKDNDHVWCGNKGKIFNGSEVYADSCEDPSFARFIFVSFLATWVLGVEKVNGDSDNCKYPAIFNFGDSNSDTGSISAAFFPRPAPNGVTFFHSPAGRVGDGRLIVDFIAKYFGLPYLSPYLDSFGTKFRHGANFATGGATIRRSNDSLFISAKRNSDIRKNFPRPKDFSKSLFIVDIGQNDLAAGFRNMMMTKEKLVAEIPDMMNLFSLGIQFLYQQGARTFWIHNTGPIGCLPSTLFDVRNPVPGFLDGNGCIKSQNDMAKEFNRQLKRKVSELKAQLPFAALTYVDMYAAKYSLISNAKKLGKISDWCKRVKSRVEKQCNIVFVFKLVLTLSLVQYSLSLKWASDHMSQTRLATLKMGFWRKFLGGFLVLCVLGVGGEVEEEPPTAAAAASPPCSFPALYNFGDSNSDTGGISAAFEPIPAPYGEGFFHKPSGRDCDGRLIVDFIAERIGLPYLSAYLNSLGTNYRHGANFATGGSTIRRPNETIYEYGISPFSLDMQIVQFNQFKARTKELYERAAKTPSERSKLPNPDEFSKALYTFDIGQNDLSVGFRKLSSEQLLAALPDIVNQLAKAVQNIYQQGGRSFWIHNTGPIGCLPVNFFYNLNPPPDFVDQFGCVKTQNEMAVEFNKKLKERVIKLRTELPEAAITYVDVYAAKTGMIGNAKAQGFTDPLKVCCGYHVKYDHVWCGTKSLVNGSAVFGSACENPSTAISWDGVHYSQAANQWVASRILNGSLTDPPIPVTQACKRH
ncbi:hypothetical protein F8388_010418, partial [Cannabis sativa]